MIAWSGKTESIRIANSHLTQLFLPQDNCFCTHPQAQTCLLFFVYSLGIFTYFTILTDDDICIGAKMSVLFSLLLC